MFLSAEMWWHTFRHLNETCRVVVVKLGQCHVHWPKFPIQAFLFINRAEGAIRQHPWGWVRVSRWNETANPVCSLNFLNIFLNQQRTLRRVVWSLSFLPPRLLSFGIAPPPNVFPMPSDGSVSLQRFPEKCKGTIPVNLLSTLTLGLLFRNSGFFNWFFFHSLL